ncbi:MAG: imelysin family protein [Bacteroidota bacterium]
MNITETLNIRKLIGIMLIVLISTLGIVSCDDDGDDPVDPDFDRAAMLESVASNLIIPNFEALQSSVNALEGAANTFAQSTDEANLATLRTTWVQAVTDHQHCSAFGFGPANLSLGPYAKVLGTFPVSEEKVERNVVTGDVDLANTFDLNAKGFYTVEYLIYGNGATDAELVASFDQARKDYLLLVIDDLTTTFDNIVSEWKSSYLQEFISSDGTSAGSSISLYYNEFVKDYENLKNFKLELPAGLTAGQESVDGSLVEAFYSGISRDLVEEHFENSKNIWFGLSRSGDPIIGFEEYLSEVEGGTALIATTKDAITVIDNAIAALPQGRLSDNIGANEVKVLRDELQANTANFKSSMSSLLGISITFNSGDGD